MLKSLAGLCIVTLSAAAMAGGSGRAIVPNERSDTLSILSPDHRLLKTVETCARPRGVHFNADRSAFFVACADDDLIAVYDTGSYQLVGRIRGVPAPETFDLHPDGRRLIVSN